MVRIYGHPFAAFYWKALIALYERDVPFEFLMIDAEHPENAEAVSRLAPTGQFPVLVDGDRTVIESAAIIEYALAGMPRCFQTLVSFTLSWRRWQGHGYRRTEFSLTSAVVLAAPWSTPRGLPRTG